MGCASSGHITKLKQSIFAFRYLWLNSIHPFCFYLPWLKGKSLDICAEAILSMNLLFSEMEMS